jgi:hypothetical protein
MVLSVTDNLVKPSLKAIRYANGSTCAGILKGINQPISREDYPTVRCVGKYHSIESVRTGKFSRGVFKVNPVTICTGRGTILIQGRFIGVLGTGYYNTGWEGHVNNNETVSNIYGIWSPTLADSSAAKAFAKLNDVDVEVGVILGELRETLHMLSNPFEALSKFFRSRDVLRRRRKEIGVPHLSKDIWLQYRYGLRPLLKDISDAINFVQKKVDKDFNRLRSVRAGCSYETNSASISANHTTGYWLWNVLRSTNTKTTSNTIVYYKLDYAASKAVTLGLHPLQFPEVAWELVRYSFVVDWFLNVGRWLRSLRPLIGMTYIGSCTSQKITIDATSETFRITYNGNPPCPGTVGEKYRWTSNTLIRKVGTTPSLLPTVNPRALSFTQALDSLALIWSGFKIKRS